MYITFEYKNRNYPLVVPTGAPGYSVVADETFKPTDKHQSRIVVFFCFMSKKDTSGFAPLARARKAYAALGPWRQTVSQLSMFTSYDPNADGAVRGWSFLQTSDGRLVPEDPELARRLASHEAADITSFPMLASVEINNEGKMVIKSTK